MSTLLSPAREQELIAQVTESLILLNALGSEKAKEQIVAVLTKLEKEATAYE